MRLNPRTPADLGRGPCGRGPCLGKGPCGCCLDLCGAPCGWWFDLYRDTCKGASTAPRSWLALEPPEWKGQADLWNIPDQLHWTKAAMDFVESHKYFWRFRRIGIISCGNGRYHNETMGWLFFTPLDLNTALVPTGPTLARAVSESLAPLHAS